jgi:hypothetical protein
MPGTHSFHQQVEWISVLASSSQRAVQLALIPRLVVHNRTNRVTRSLQDQRAHSRCGSYIGETQIADLVSLLQEGRHPRPPHPQSLLALRERLLIGVVGAARRGGPPTRSRTSRNSNTLSVEAHAERAGMAKLGRA